MDVLKAFLNAVPASAKRSASGWLNFNCPACGDTRGRCGFLETGSGGFRVRCFNGQCPFNDASTGWEPGGGLGGRPRKLFQLLGGDLRDLPIDAVIRTADKFDRRGNRDVATEADSPVVRFDAVEMPAGSMPLPDAVVKDWDHRTFTGLTAVCDYVYNTLSDEVEASRFAWSPKNPTCIVVPFWHWGRIVGWQARDCGPQRKFFSKCPPDFIFAQDSVERKTGRAVIASEGVTTAMSLDCLAVRNASPTKKQEAFLRNLGRRVILLPDQEESGLAFVDCAERNGWEVSIPNWDAGVKNGSDAAARYGTLYAVSTVVAGATDNYIRARVALKVRGAA